MRSKASVVAVVLLLISQLAHAQPGSPPTPANTAEVQMAVEKGLFFVEQKSMEWWKAEKCATCHEGQILLVAANVAKDQGIPVDREKLDFWTDRWVLVDALIDYKDGRLNGLGIPTAPFALLHRDHDRDRSEGRAKQWAEALRILFRSQGDDGSWTPKAAFVDITPRMALALVDLEKSEIPFPSELRREITERRRLTEDWIKTREPQLPEKTESLAGWVVYEHQRGEPERAKKLLDELLSRRREDGGWGISKADPSHLLITSVVLLALKTSGLPNDHPVVIETQRFLLSKQSNDGRWRELGRYFHPEQYHTAYDTWTTGYAVAALSLTIPKLGPNATRLFTPDPELAAEVERLTQAAAKDYQGQPDRTGDPTQTEPPEKYK